MWPWLKNALGIAVLAVLCLAVWGGFGLTRQAYLTLAQWGDTGAQLDKTLEIVNQPCGGGHPCGTLAEIGESTRRITDMTTTLQMQTKHTGELIAATTRNLDSAAADLHMMASAATQTVQDAGDALVEGKRSIAAVQPVLESLQAEINSLHALTPPAQRALESLAETAAHLDGVGADFQKVSDHFEQEIDHPAKKSGWQKAKIALEMAWKAAVLFK